MSRRSKSSSKNKGGVSKDGLLPSYPSENYREHRKFLIRSLERNDVDMSALIKLNKSLHMAKGKIIQTCGELVLLDLGSGRLKLINDELHEETTDATSTTTSTDTNTTATTGSPARNSTANIHQHHLTPAQKEVCVDFLLRMKLRRKLSNRLIRRLNRVAHAMDGKDVSPPSPPKYGDLGLHIDPKSIEARTAEWKEQEEAKKRVQKALDGDYSAYNLEEKGTGPAIVEDTGNVEVTKHLEEKSKDDEHGKVEKGENEEVKTNNAEAQDEALPEEPKSATEESTPPESNETHTKDKAADSDENPKTVESSAATDKKDDEHGKVGNEEVKTNNAEAQDEALPEEPKSATEESTPPESNETHTKDKAADSDENPKTVESSAATDKKEPVDSIMADLDLETTQEANNSSSSSSSPTLAGDIELLKEYETAFEKSWDPSLKKFKYVFGKEEVGDPEYTQIKQWGIGASSIIMTLEDRKSEHLRWERNMLTRIPEQPTTEDLGLKNRVFDLEERRKRCLEDNVEEDEQGESNISSAQSPMKKKIKFDEGTKPGKESTVQKVGGKELKNTSVESDDDEKSKSSDSDNEDDDVEMKKEKKEAIIVTPVKPISFVAVPSFHDQDLARIRMIHNELVNTSRLEHTRKRLADATNDYNKGK